MAAPGAGFRAFNARLPKERLAVVVLSNINFEGSMMPWVLPMIARISQTVVSSYD